MRRWPLPQPVEGGDKEERGRVLVVGGTRETPGAVILAATAALRAGAGKLRVAVPCSIAQVIASAVPEARVFALPETKAGTFADSSAVEITERANETQAVLFGPGVIGEDALSRLMERIVPRLDGPTVIIDAEALLFLAGDPKSLHELGGNVVLTPNADEMASVLGLDKATLKRDPLETARRAALDFQAVIALKGAETFIAAPAGEAYCNRTGNVGLATSGSGDVLSGIIAGLAARGAEPLQAASWGVYLHASAGDRLARRIGPLGYLARELLAEVPRLMSELDGRKKQPAKSLFPKRS